MAGISISGLSSGLDTRTIVSQLMSIEALSQTALKDRVTATERQISALQSINTRLSSITQAAARLVPGTNLGATTPGAAWSAMTVTSSSTAVTAASTGTGAGTPGSISFTVTSAAQAHSVATGTGVAADESVLSGPGRLTVTRSDGTSTTIRPGGGGTLADVAAALNDDASLGLRAVVLEVEPDSYRLQVTSTQTGDAGTFTLGGFGRSAGTTTVVSRGSDAVVDLGGGLEIRSATGVFTDVLPGASFTVRSKPEGTVTVDLAKDATGTTASAKALVDSVNVALSELKSQSATTTVGATTTAGPLAGDGLVRGLTQNILSSVTAGSSAAAAGIQLTREGTLVFDEAVFTKAMADDPVGTQSLVTGLAERIAAVVKSAGDAREGTIASSITSRKGSVTDLGNQITAWDTRLELRRSTLERQFASLETALSGLQAQSGYLASQLSGLPTWS